MSDPIKIEDTKEAALHAILTRLQEIDENTGSRNAFVGGLAFQMMHGMDKPIFEPEIELMQLALGIEPKRITDEKREGVTETPKTPREFQLGGL
jgi:hypothetical protein